MYERERLGPQRLRVSLDLDLDAPGLLKDDGLAFIHATIGYGHVTLIETIAERIAAACLADPRVLVASVRVEKLDVFPDAVVGVEIRRSRAESNEPGSFPR